MFRLIGAIMVAGGAAAIGLIAAGKLKTRVDALSGLLAAIDVMQSEIFFRLTPLPDLIKMLEKQSEAPAKTLFSNCVNHIGQLGQKPFFNIWTQALEESRSLELLPAEKQILKELGNILGRYDADGQIKAIAYIHRRLETCLEASIREKEKQGKLYRMLGIVTGAAVAIILL
jgi:stage III sporulation protein AB